MLFSFLRESRGENTAGRLLLYTMHTSESVIAEGIHICVLSCNREIIYQVTVRPSFHLVCHWSFALCFIIKNAYCRMDIIFIQEQAVVRQH